MTDADWQRYLTEFHDEKAGITERVLNRVDGSHQTLDVPTLLVWAHLTGHHSRRTYRTIARCDWLEVEDLPTYALTLNPVESMWSTLKRTTLANLAARTVDELTTAVHAGLDHPQPST